VTSCSSNGAGAQPAALAELGVQGALDRRRHVEPDHVEELERAHRVAAAGHRRQVDVVGGGVVLREHPDRVVEVGEQQRVDDEPRPVAARDRVLAEPAGDVDGGREDIRGRRHGVHHLDQAHHRRRVEVQPDDVAGRRVAAAHSITGSDDVVVASSSSGRQTASRSAKSARLTASSSTTASTTRSASATSASGRAARPAPGCGASPPRGRSPRRRCGRRTVRRTHLGEDLHDAGGHRAQADHADRPDRPDGAGLRPGRGVATGLGAGLRVGNDRRRPGGRVGVEAAPALAAEQPRGCRRRVNTDPLEPTRQQGVKIHPALTGSGRGRKPVSCCAVDLHRWSTARLTRMHSVI